MTDMKNQPEPMTDDEVFDLTVWEEEQYRPCAPADVIATARNIVAARDDQWIGLLARQFGWQPIETAPKDGTKVDLWLECLPADFSERVTDCWWENGAWMFYKNVHGAYEAAEVERPRRVSRDGRVHERKATHWMLTPGAPKG